MVEAVSQVPVPVNEPVKAYAPGSAERADIERALAALRTNVIDLPSVIGGRDVLAPLLVV